jgi:DNA topoisomerase-1
MSRIAEGQRDLPTVVRESQEILEKALIALESKVDVIREDVNQALRQQKRVGACPRCGKDLLIRQSRNRKRFVGCSGYPECTNTYPLPQSGLLVTTDESCGNCGAPAVKLIFRGRRPRLICVNMGCGAKPKSEEKAATASPKKESPKKVRKPTEPEKSAAKPKTKSPSKSAKASAKKPKKA